MTSLVRFEEPACPACVFLMPRPLLSSVDALVWPLSYSDASALMISFSYGLSAALGASSQ
jgi:hypothetical protein